MDSTPFAHQVGGHASSIQSSPIGSSALIKPSSAREHEFYTSVGPALHPALVGEWTPSFFGTLTLTGKVGEAGAIESTEGVGESMLVLENLTYRFLKPNVLDIKLGTQLHDEQATSEKQERMMQASKSTTSWQTGMRMTGFQVWDSETSTFIKTDKSYGKSLTPSTLPEGLSQFFRLTSDISTSIPKPSTPKETPDVDKNSSSESTSATPLPPTLLFRVLEELLTRLQDLDHLLHDLEFRMRGGSILIVVEGDAEALEEALYREAAQELRSSQKRERRREIGVMSGEVEESDEEDVEGFYEDDDDASSSASDDSAATSDSAGLALPHTRISLDVRLIDFAHTRAAPGEGPDEGVLEGLRSLQQLVMSLIERLKFEHPSECEE